jgi:hypothetical protein
MGPQLLGAPGAVGLDDRRPVVVGVSSEKSVVGGLLPAGATAAEVVGRDGDRHRAECAAGVWLVALSEPASDDTVPVKFLDPDDRIVRPHLPEEWRSEPVRDANETCPVCEAVEWDQVWPTDDSRGGTETPNGGFVPTPIVVCRVCGHEESVGVWYAASDDARPVAPEEAERIRVIEQKHARLTRDALGSVDFKVYR